MTIGSYFTDKSYFDGQGSYFDKGSYFDGQGSMFNDKSMFNNESMFDPVQPVSNNVQYGIGQPMQGEQLGQPMQHEQMGMPTLSDLIKQRKRKRTLGDMMQQAMMNRSG